MQSRAGVTFWAPIQGTLQCSAKGLERGCLNLTKVARSGTIMLLTFMFEVGNQCYGYL